MRSLCVEITLHWLQMAIDNGKFSRPRSLGRVEESGTPLLDRERRARSITPTTRIEAVVVETRDSGVDASSDTVLDGRTSQPLAGKSAVDISLVK